MRTPTGTATPRDANPAHAASAELFAALADAGVAQVCVCPGSRSAPLAIAAAQTPGLRVWTQIDERAAAFFALGLAKTSRMPVALVCTSGSAAANLLPAVVEARYSGVPLVLLTADRPPELRGVGAGQTIDQTRLFGSHVRWFAEAALPEPGAATLRHFRSLAERALAQALGPPAGPVHLNLPFREPLEPAGPLAGAAAPEPRALAGPRLERRAAPPAEAEIDALCRLARERERGVLACGPLDLRPGAAAAIARFAQLAGWPLLADPLSQLRCGAWTAEAPVIASSDLLLRDADFAARHAAELVLRIGASPTSKALRLWLEGHPPDELVLIDPERERHDPSGLATRVWHCDPELLCAAASERLAGPPPRRSPHWLASWRRAESQAALALDEAFADDAALLEPNAVRALADELPDGALLVVSNSMAVRELDAFLPASRRALRVLGNRGASGIDGLVSTALGCAAARAGATLLLTGDLAFLHDAGGLLAAHRHALSLAVVVLDNDGGGIFSYLPIAAQAERVHFEELFRTPHGLDLAPIAAAYGATAVRIGSLAHLRSALKDALVRAGVTLLVVPVDRDRSVEAFRARAAAVAAATSRERR